jgi:hypothetical protein
MHDLDDIALERRLREVLEERLGALPLDLTVETLDRRREARGGARRFRRGRGMTLLAAAALLLLGGALAAGSGLLRRPAVVPPVPAPSLAAVAPSPEASGSPITAPTPTAPPIVWTQASLKQDWPAPVRPEPSGGASVGPMPPTYIDPAGDTGPDAVSYVDIRDVTASTESLSFQLTSKPPKVDPSKTWIAFGLVIDEDGDGVPDWRYGIDNVPSAMAMDAHRAWRTNLHTGVTEFDPDPEPNGWGVHGDPLFPVGAAQFGTGYPSASATGPRFLFSAHGDVAGGGTYKAGAKQDKPFYVWASTIVDGQIVATDYAPDTGWLRPTPDGTNPGGTYVLTGKFLDGPAPFRLSMIVPHGWSTAGPTLEPPNASGTSLRFLLANHPAMWACDSSGHSIEPQVGPTVDDLASFLSHQPRLTVSRNTDVTVDGHSGTYLEYTTSYDDNTNCVPTDWPFDAAAFHQLWILDVDGARMVIDASAPKASEATKADFSQIVDSIAFEPPTRAEALPTATPTPVPTPTPTPFPPTYGPVPHGARPWEVTVENKSSKPATLFLATEPFNGPGDQCGSVTPDVVPPGVTETVTFLLPPKSVNDCWLMIRPGPGAGGDFGPTDEWPASGKLIVSDGGDNANGDDVSTVWQGP